MFGPVLLRRNRRGRASREPTPGAEEALVTTATLSISNKNYSSWSLRGWLLCRMAKLEFEEKVIPMNDVSMRAELLLLSPSFRVPRLDHDGAAIWDTLAIAEYLRELKPNSTLLPTDRLARAHCRSISGEMHSGFANLRAALPMNLRARYDSFKVWSGAQADIDRVTTIWRECLEAYGGPYLFGEQLSMADAMYAPVVTRFRTYGVALDADCEGYCRTILAWPDMAKWIDDALCEPDELAELDVEF